MSIEKYKKNAIQHHLSGIEKLKDGAKDWIASWLSVDESSRINAVDDHT